MFPVPIQQYLRTLKGTPDEVWSKVLAIHYSTEKHTMDEWAALLNGLRTLPAFA